MSTLQSPGNGIGNRGQTSPVLAGPVVPPLFSSPCTQEFGPWS
ncbi:MAG: hypothetical protein WCZ02_07580 [Lysobacterales bacterium]